jgi:hypothetical protein
MTADNYSSQQSRRGIAGKQLGIPRVDAQHLKGFVASLVADALTTLATLRAASR